MRKGGRVKKGGEREGASEGCGGAEGGRVGGTERGKEDGNPSKAGVTGQESSRARSSPIWRMTNHGEISTPRDQS